MGAMSCHSCCYQHGTGTSRQPPKWPPVLDRCSFQKDKLPSWKKVVILSNSDGSHALQPTTSTPPPFNLHFGGFTNLSTCLLLHFWLNPYKPEAKELTIRLSWKQTSHRAVQFQAVSVDFCSLRMSLQCLESVLQIPMCQMNVVVAKFMHIYSANLPTYT